MTIREAVYQACEELDVHSSMNELVKAASIIYGHPLNKGTVQIYRCNYRKANKLNVDCRTYKGQPRRNMLNDERHTLDQVKRLHHYFGLKRPTIASFKNLIGDGREQFHSVVQLVNAIDDLVAFRAVA